MEGYVKLHRKILENKYWLEPRKKSKFEAWIYLLLRASYKDREIIFGNVDLSLKAGEFITSQLKLAEEWGWNRETVVKYLGRLKADNQVDYKTNNKFTVVSICNWNSYQNGDKENPAIELAIEPTSNQHQNQQHADNESSTNKKDNKEKKVKNKDIDDFFSYYLAQTKKNFKLTSDKANLIDKRLKEGYTLDQLKQAVDNFVLDTWEGRAECLDLIYCIGKQRGKPDNLEKWLNFIPKTERLV